jgi:hypothetical protein
MFIHSSYEHYQDDGIYNVTYWCEGIIKYICILGFSTYFCLRTEGSMSSISTSTVPPPYHETDGFQIGCLQATPTLKSDHRSDIASKKCKVILRTVNVSMHVTELQCAVK